MKNKVLDLMKAEMDVNVVVYESAKELHDIEIMQQLTVEINLLETLIWRIERL